jgi:hypothetical protein
LGAIETNAKLEIQIKRESKDKGNLKWFTRVEIQFIVGINGHLEVDPKEVGAGLGGRRLSYVSQRLNKLSFFLLISYHGGVSFLIFSLTMEENGSMYYYNPLPMNLKQELKFSDNHLE